MKREDEITKAAMEYAPDCRPSSQYGTGNYEPAENHSDQRECFTDGAQWADSNPSDEQIKTIVKALCNYRQSNINWYKDIDRTVERLKADFIGKEDLKITTTKQQQ